MKKVYIAIALAGALSATEGFAAFANDGTITLSDNGPGPSHYGNGGQFWAQTTPNGVPNLGNFYTFCLEHGENIGLPGTYRYQISSGAVAGGVNLGTPHVDPNTGFSQDYISLGTAWLYSQFRSGGLGSLTASQAGQLQNAFWFLEDEIDAAGLTTANGVDGTYYYNLAVNAVTAALVKDDANGAYGVVALNLFTQNADGSQSRAQDQLGIVPEPSTVIAAALLLLPFGASTIRILRKNRVA